MSSHTLGADRPRPSNGSSTYIHGMIPTRKRFDGCGYQSCRETSDLDPVVVPDWVVGIYILEVGSEIGEQGLSPVMQLPAVSGHSCLGARAQAWGRTSVRAKARDVSVRRHKGQGFFQDRVSERRRSRLLGG